MYFPKVLLFIVIMLHVTIELRAWEVFDGPCYSKITHCYFPELAKDQHGQYSSLDERSCHGRCKERGFIYGYCGKTPWLCKDPERVWKCRCSKKEIH